MRASTTILGLLLAGAGGVGAISTFAASSRNHCRTYNHPSLGFLPGSSISLVCPYGQTHARRVGFGSTIVSPMAATTPLNTYTNLVPLRAPRSEKGARFLTLPPERHEWDVSPSSSSEAREVRRKGGGGGKGPLEILTVALRRLIRWWKIEVGGRDEGRHHGGGLRSQQQQQQQQSPSKNGILGGLMGKGGAFRSILMLGLVGLVVSAAPWAAHPMGVPSLPADGPPAPSLMSPWQRIMIFICLFSISAAFHAAETSITTLYPWKVREFAKEEGEKSPFKVLDKDITRVLTTILVATTACTIYSAALFTNLAMELLGARGVAYSTVGLTVITLVFGELIPKSLGVSSAEMVARIMVPPINLLAVVLSPIGKMLSMFAKLFLRLLGIKADDDERVSEDQLRLLVAGAQKSGGIEAQEGQMINQVLNMQEKRVSEAMCPRVDVEALDKGSSLRQLQELFQRTKYSRIPVFDGEIDRIIGVVMSKDLLEYVFQKDPSVLDMPVETIMQPTYFIPETMTIWTCFQEMRQRRVHMAVVVDEYGGTAGVITLEDIQEEVFGEIYDEEDDTEDHHGEDLIKMVEEDIYLIQGNADLEDVCEVLGLEINEEQRGDFATFGGYLCSLAGEIPAISDHIVVPGYVFTIVQADERRIIEVRVERIYAPEGDRDEGGDRGDREGSDSDDDDSEDEYEEGGNRVFNNNRNRLREKVEQ